MPNVTAEEQPPYDDDLWHGEIAYVRKYNDKYRWSWRAVRVVYVDQWGYGLSEDKDYWNLVKDNPYYGTSTLFKIYAKFRAKRLAAKLNAVEARKRKHTEAWGEA